ncbi:MAG TPA: BamA/TamA family outer membrane protein [Chitinispirillaceae bacterium]|nr:BamA/TamA family outer membrane protein [Chitinispirillaceae bacterium]
MNNFLIKPVKSILLPLLIVVNVTTVFSFGKNKVQYSPFSWWMRPSTHFNLYYHQNINTLPEIAYKWVDNAYKSLSEGLNFTHTAPIPLLLYGSPSLFAQTNVISEILPEGVGGFTEIFKTRIVVPFTGSYSELRHVLHHEMVHAFVFGIVFDKFGGASAMLNNAQIPFWFNEGAAEYLSTGWNCEADMFMMEQTLNNTIALPGPQLNGYMAYKGGQSFLHFINESRGDSAFSSFLHEFRKTKQVDNSILKVYKKTTEDLGKEWIKELRRLYWPEIGQREDPSSKCSFITSHMVTKDQFNLRPRISPDGQKIAFFSDRKDYTRILITNKKGKVLQEISQNGYGGFFESFHPFRSGMCWSPDGNKLAFVTLNRGRDEIRIINLRKKRLIKKIRLSLNSISSPDWSKNGKEIVFSAIKDGYNDLFVYNIELDSLKRLTESVECEADPHFSPDDQKVIFSLEDTTGSAQHPQCAYGPTPGELAIIELPSGKLSKITNTAWNEKQPCFSPDGKNIIYVSDRNGLDNLYICPLELPENSRPLTDFVGGCSNPDWAQDTQSVVFSLFQNQGWDILLIDKPNEKLTKDSLVNTQWVKRWIDSSRTFYKKVDIKADSISELKEPARAGKRHRTPVGALTSAQSKRDAKDGKTTADSNSTIQVDSSVSIDSMHISDKAATIDSSTDSSNTKTASDTSLAQSNKTLLDTTISLKQNTPKDTTIPAIKVLPYRLKFTPDMVALGVGISNYYSPAGQMLLSFSDLMGDHQITVAADLQGNFKDYMHLFASYIFLRNRADVGGGGFYNKDYSYADLYGTRLYHDEESGGFLFIRYPFSTFTRLDFEFFYRNIKREPVESDAPIVKTTSFLPSASFSFDNILWGITGPLNGIRISSKIIFSPPLDFVDDHFISFDTDIRTYLHMFSRFVWANRVFIGISKSLNDNPSARRYFLGGNENWFSYSINREQYDNNIYNSFYSDFITPFRGYNYLDITGSRVAVFNSEFRFPFIREISIAWPLPVQIRYINGALFTDIGNAWDSAERYHGFPLPGKIYGGFGFGLRADLGFFILRFDRGWPTDWRRDIGKPINYFSLGAEY